LGFPIQLSILCDRNLYEAAKTQFLQWVLGKYLNKSNIHILSNCKIDKDQICIPLWGEIRPFNLRNFYISKKIFFIILAKEYLLNLLIHCLLICKFSN